MDSAKIAALWDMMQNCDDKITRDHLFAAVNRQFQIIEDKDNPPEHEWTYDSKYSSLVRNSATRLHSDLIKAWGKPLKIEYNKIPLIRELRTKSNCDLKTAKEFIEQYFSVWYK